MRKYKQNTINYKAQESKLRMVSFASLGFVGIIALLALFPSINQATKAAENVDVAVRAGANISISVDPNVAMEATATDNSGKFTSGSANVTITTNNRTGYQIFMTSASSGQTTLKSPDASISSTIKSLSANTVGSKMTGDTWGYSIGTGAISSSSTFKPIPASAKNAIHETNAASATTGDKYQLGFGAHISPSLPAGTYTNSMVVSVVAKYVPPTLEDISTMQSITSEACSNTAVGYSKELTDTRDNKTYYVTKLKDGHCWMTQNLAYEFNTSKTLTSSDSDVTSNWKIPNNAKQLGTAGSATSASTDMWIRDDDPDDWGNYYSLGAATAGESTSKTNVTSSSSICPRGWRLPTSDEYTTLLNGITGILNSPYHMAPVGYVMANSGTATSQGSKGYLWVANIGSGGFAPTFEITMTTSSATSSQNAVYNGLSVRCIAK